MKNTFLLFSIWFALVMTTLAGDRPVDAKAIQGTWLMVKAELNGQAMKDDSLKKITLKLDGGKCEVTAESVDKGTYTLDPAAKPKILDIIDTEGPNVGRKIPAIYELQGDTLRVCYGLGGTRPTEFKSLGGTQTFLVTYQRKKA